MCGIIGYIGDKDVVPMLLEGLKHLEYPGYDSAGIAVFSYGRIKIAKRSGKIKNLVSMVKSFRDLNKSNLGIGHSRWATHGAPTNINAHPHHDCSGRIAVV